MTNQLLDECPEWFLNASKKKLDIPCLKVTIQQEEYTHDGYCSDGEEFEVFMNTIIVYVTNEPEIKEWKVDTGHCCCCSAHSRYKVVKIESI
jgi:hypothetical protein